MPSHSLIHSRSNRLSQLGALLVMLVACGSEAGTAPPEGTQESTSMGNSSAGAPASTATTSQPTAAGQAQKPSTPPSTPSTPSSNSSMNSATPATPNTPNTPSTPGAQTPAQNAAGMGAAPMDPMDATDPMDPAMNTDPMVQLPMDTGTRTLYWLEIVSGIVVTATLDASGKAVGQKTVASGGSLSAPDGVTIDPEGKHFFVLNMGTVIGGGNQGSLVRYNLDGSGSEVIMKPGSKAGDATFNTGKQVTIDRVNKKLYMGDREGSKVWRCDYDGGNLEVLVSEHGVQQIVGVGADPTKRHFYFSDRNGKKLFRASMDMPAGETHADRKDVELIYVEKASSAMPLDIELDLEHRMIYWTDRTQGKILGMHMDIPMGETPENRSDVKTIADGLVEAIGLAYDHQESTLFVTHNGTVSSVKTDGSGLTRIGTNGRTGIAFARIQP